MIVKNGNSENEVLLQKANGSKMAVTGKVIFNDTRLRGFWLYKWYQTASMLEKQEAFGQVIPLIVNGTLKADIDSRYSVDEIEQAVTRAWEGGRNGKVLIVPSSLE